MLQGYIKVIILFSVKVFQFGVCPTYVCMYVCLFPAGVCGRVSECPQYTHLVKDIQDKNVVQFFLNRICKYVPRVTWKILRVL